MNEKEMEMGWQLNQ